MAAARTIFAFIAISFLAACEPENNRDTSTDRTSPGLNSAGVSERELGRAMRQAARLERNQRYDEAIAIYEDLLGPGPNEYVVNNNLAALLLDRRSDDDSHKRALALMEQYSASTDAILRDTLGWAYYRNGHYQKAIRHFEYAALGEASTELENPERSRGLSATFRYHLAKAYAQSGITAGAVSELRNAIELAPNDWAYEADAQETLDSLTQQ